jgi:hypothetical protein
MSFAHVGGVHRPSATSESSPQYRAMLARVLGDVTVASEDLNTILNTVQIVLLAVIAHLTGRSRS